MKKAMKNAVKRSSSQPQRVTRPITWRARLLVYLVLLLAALGVRYWYTSPAIPRPDLTTPHPELVAAIDEAEDRVRRSPRSADSWGQLGVVLLAHRYSEEADACFQRAAELDRENWRWLYLKSLPEQRYRPEQAVDTLRDAIVRDRSAELPQVVRGELLLGLGRLEEAERQLRDVLRSEPKSARAHLALAHVLFAREQYSEALPSLEHAKTNPSSRRKAHELMAQIHQHLGREAEAQQALAMASRFPPDAPWPDALAAEVESARVDKSNYLRQATVLEESGASAEGLALLQEAERKYRDVYFLVEGRSQLEQGDGEGAEAAFREALRHDPESLEALCGLGQALARQEKYDEAKDTLQQLLQKEPGYGPAYLELGRCLKGRDDEAALEAFQAAARYMPHSAETRAELAEILSQLGRHEEAELHRATANKKHP